MSYLLNDRQCIWPITQFNNGLKMQASVQHQKASLIFSTNSSNTGCWPVDIDRSNQKVKILIIHWSLNFCVHISWGDIDVHETSSYLQSNSFLMAASKPKPIFNLQSTIDVRQHWMVKWIMLPWNLHVLQLNSSS